MKRFTLFSTVMVLAVAALAGCGKSGEGLSTTPPEYRLYGEQNIYIEYEYGGGATGTKKQYIGNYGMYERTEDDFSVKMGEENRPVKQLVIRQDSIQYMIDLLEKVGRKGASQLEELKPMMVNFNAEQKKNVNMELMRSMGGTKIGTETVLGKECEVYDVQGFMKVAMWQGITMRSEMDMGGLTMTLTAKKIEMNPSLSLDMFTAPKDVKITEVSNSGMPPGHPPVDDSGLPEGHPPVDGGAAPGGEMPAGHPPVDGSAPHGGAMPQGGSIPHGSGSKTGPVGSKK